MLSVRLPDPLASQLTAYCQSAGVSKSSVVQAALEKHLKKQMATPAANKPKHVKHDPLLAMVGSGNRKFSTDQIMRMTRGADWNKP